MVERCENLSVMPLACHLPFQGRLICAHKAPLKGELTPEAAEGYGTARPLSA